MVLRVGLQCSDIRKVVFASRLVASIVGAIASLGVPVTGPLAPGGLGAVSAQAQQQTGNADRSCARCRATERTLRSIQGELDRQRRARERLYTLISRSDQQIARINEAKERNAQAVARAARERSDSTDSNRLVELERNLVRLRQQTVRLDRQLRAAIEQKEARTAQVGFTEAAVRTYRQALSTRTAQVQTCRSQCLPPLQERVSNDPRVLSLDLTRFSVATCPECASFVLEANRRSAETLAARNALQPLRNAFERTQRRVTELDGRRDQRLLQLVSALRAVTRFAERDRAAANTAKLNQVRSQLASVLNELRGATNTRQQAFSRLENGAQGVRDRLTAYEATLEQNPGCVTQCRGVRTGGRTSTVTRDGQRPDRTGRDTGTSGDTGRAFADANDRRTGRANRPARRAPDPGDAQDRRDGKATDRLGGDDDNGTDADVIDADGRPRTTVVGNGRDTFAVGRGRGLARAAPRQPAKVMSPRSPVGSVSPASPIAAVQRQRAQRSRQPQQSASAEPAEQVIEARLSMGRPYGGDAGFEGDFGADGSLKDAAGMAPAPRAVVSVRGGAGQRRYDGATLGTKTFGDGWRTEVSTTHREIDFWSTRVELTTPGAQGVATPDLGQNSTTWQVDVKIGEGDNGFSDTQADGVTVALGDPAGMDAVVLGGPVAFTDGAIETDLTKVRAAARLGYYDRSCGGGIRARGHPGDADLEFGGAMPLGRCQFGALFGVGYEALDERIRATVRSAAGTQSVERATEIETVDLTAGLWTRIDLPVHQFANGGLVRFVADGEVYTKTGFADADLGLTVGNAVLAASDGETYFGGGGALDVQLQLQWSDFAIGLGARFEAETIATLTDGRDTDLGMDTDFATDAQVYLEAKMPF